MVNPEGFTVIDGTMDIEKQQNLVRKHALKSLGNKKTFLGDALQEGNDIKVVTRDETKKANQQKQ